MYAGAEEAEAKECWQALDGMKVKGWVNTDLNTEAWEEPKVADDEVKAETFSRDWKHAQIT